VLSRKHREARHAVWWLGGALLLRMPRPAGLRAALNLGWIEPAVPNPHRGISTDWRLTTRGRDEWRRGLPERDRRAAELRATDAFAEMLRITSPSTTRQVGDETRPSIDWVAPSASLAS
jgi:hypothetical protein